MLAKIENTVEVYKIMPTWHPTTWRGEHIINTTRNDNLPGTTGSIRIYKKHFIEKA